MKYLILAVCLTILMMAGCKKNKPKTELEKLPPITRTGANTLGCLINGVAWIPKDNYGQATFKLDVDPSLGNGIFVLSASQFQESNLMSFAFGSVGCKEMGEFNLSAKEQVFSYSNPKILCSFDNNSANVYVSGSFIITKYDLINRIFSGTFEFTLYNQNCGDTLYFTNGRFDKKL